MYDERCEMKGHYKLVFVTSDVRNVHIVGRRTDIFLFGIVKDI